MGKRTTRRQFLGAGGALAAGLASGALRPRGAAASPAAAAPVPGAAASSDRRRRAADRVKQAQGIRVEAARKQGERRLPPLETNGDESRYPDRIASFSKTLPHDALGQVDVKAFDALAAALDSGIVAKLEAVPRGGDLRMANPWAGLAYGLEGAESCQIPLAPPPAFASAEQAGEACELYWQAVTRDVPFAEYEGNALVQQACEDLSRLSAFAGPKRDGRVTAGTVFRGPTPGDLAGPYVSQFLWKELPYGAIRVVQQVRTATPGLEHMTTFEDWLAVQNGASTPARHASAYRYIHSARDMTSYVHLDFTYQAFLSACLILFGMQGTTDARRPYKGAPYDAGNPYRASKNQSGFVTLGVGHALDLVARVANDALRACWYQKWMVHRRLRPEELGGRVHNHRTGAARYALHAELLDSPVLELVHKAHGSYLLPQAYPEGSPTHPSYPAGHAAIAGACATVLKAFFEESFPIDDPVSITSDGLKLVPYTGRELTVGGELNKLAANISLGRDAAGIHWRSDGIEGLKLGEAVALSVLGEIRACVHEDFGGFNLTTFDGTTVKV